VLRKVLYLLQSSFGGHAGAKPVLVDTAGRVQISSCPYGEVVSSESNFTHVLSAAAKLPGVRIVRAAYLAQIPGHMLRNADGEEFASPDTWAFR
jgi:hypothetical protein